MRRTLDGLIWVLVVSATAVAFLSAPPEVEALYGVPACANTPHNGPCRFCVQHGSTRLPGVIGASNVRLLPAVRSALADGDR